MDKLSARNGIYSKILELEEDRLTTPSWYALYTRSRHEKKVYEGLAQRRLETFLPTRKISRQWSDRLQEIREPLFRGYLFVKIPLARKLDVLKVDGVVCIVSSAGHAISVPEKDLMTIRDFIEKEIPVDPFPYLHCGQHVRVSKGILKGAEGILVSKRGQCRLVVSLDLLCQAVSVQIDAENVQPLN